MVPKPATQLEADARGGLLSAGLAIPECDEGIGDIIRSPDSVELIAEVRVEPFALWSDDRGYFLEVARMGQGLVSRYPLTSTQVSAALGHPGAIKAFHYHVHQTDVWVPAKGMIQVALVDLRRGSATFGRRNTMYIGELRPWSVLIPPGVAHGYKVLGSEPAMLVYVTDRLYDPKDEGRISYNDALIRYDWQTQHK